MLRRILTAGLVLAAAVLVTGIGCTKITRGNYESVKPGMTTEKELAKIMGQHTWSPSGREMKMGEAGDDVWMYRMEKEEVDIFFYIDRDTRVVAAKVWEPWGQEPEVVGEIPEWGNSYREKVRSK